MNADDETNVTDIQLLPDGRICVFGTSEEVLEVLDELQGGQDPAVARRLEASRGHVVAEAAHETITNRGNHG